MGTIFTPRLFDICFLIFMDRLSVFVTETLLFIFSVGKAPSSQYHTDRILYVAHLQIPMLKHPFHNGCPASASPPVRTICRLPSSATATNPPTTPTQRWLQRRHPGTQRAGAEVLPPPRRRVHASCPVPPPTLFHRPHQNPLKAKGKKGI